jgi:hypothetical protein
MDAKKLVLAGYHRWRQYLPSGWLYHRDYFAVLALPHSAADSVVETRLRHILHTAARHVPWYRRRVRLSDDELANENVLALLDRFPYIDKRCVMERQRDFLDERLDPRLLAYATSSGSTGLGIGMWRTKRLADIEKAFFVRAWSRYGFSFDKSRYLRIGADLARPANAAPTRACGNRLMVSPHSLKVSARRNWRAGAGLWIFRWRCRRRSSAPRRASTASSSAGCRPAIDCAAAAKSARLARHSTTRVAQSMELDPKDTIEQAAEAAQKSSRLNMLVAVTVALLSTFMGICKVKDDNIVQAMQQAQANKLDHWAFYQARNIRQEVAKAATLQLQLAAAGAPTTARPDYDKAVARYQQLVADQEKKKEEVRAQAEQDQKDYDAWNFRDDQFDLSDAFLAITVALLAMTSLTQQRWLYWGAMVPAGFGVLMGCAGLFGWPIHPSWLTALLS